VGVNLNDVLSRFSQNVRNVAAISLHTGIMTEAAVPHLVMTAFKNLAALGVQTGYEFEQLKGASSAPAPAQAEKKEAKKEEVKQPEPEEEADVDMGGLFDF
jgi:large subunit ribosomal protein LP0